MAKKVRTFGQKASALRSSMKTRCPDDTNIPTQPEIKAWLEAQPMVCAYTGEKLTMATLSIDHRQPLARGGSNQLDNLCLTSKGMNNAKGTMTEKEFLDLLALLSTFEDKGKKILTRLRMAGGIFG